MASYIEVRRVLIVLCLILSIPQIINGGPIYKTKTMYVGDSFSISPWSELNSTPELSGCTCMSTSCRCTTPNAFTIEVTSTTTTTYWYENLQQHGSYSTYKVTALKSGTFEVIGSASGIRKKDMVWQVGIGTSVIYTVTVKERPVVTSITIPSTLNLLEGSSYTFSPVIAEEGATTQLTWTSSNPNVVSVTSGGVIKALRVGNATITCTASNGVSAKCVVTVSPILVSSITLDKSELEINVDDRYTLSATVLPENANNKTIEWSSSNENVAFVSADGTVIAISPGYCNIYASSTDGSNKKAACLVHVVAIIEPYVVQIDSILTFYFDANKHSRSGVIYSIQEEYSYSSPNPWANNNVSRVIFDSSFAQYYPTSTAYWFWRCTDLKAIDNIKYLKTDSVTNMGNMFASCNSITQLDVSGFNTANVKGMAYMFDNCSELTSIDVSNFNTSKLISIAGMFNVCTKLTSIDLSQWRLPIGVYGDYMFWGCTNLIRVNLTNAINASFAFFTATHMFDHCSSLKTIYSSCDWNFEIALGEMFEDCVSLVGGAGTTFNPSWIGEGIARIDRGESAPGYFTLLGDVNSDCKINISDVTALINLLLADDTNGYAGADVDFNGIINIKDVTALINKLLSEN